MRTTRSLACQKTDADGFTQIDLLAVIMIFGILCALLLPALAGTKPNSQVFQCLENQRQLVRAWLMYSGDFNERIALTGGTGDTADTLTDWRLNNGNWCHGRMDETGAAATDPFFVKAGSLFPYTKSPSLYKCPADTKTQPNAAAVITPTTRSMSMNCFLNPISYPSFGGGVSRIYIKQTDILSAVNTWVTIDESPGSINDGSFICDPFGNPGIWVDIPASYHNNAGTMSFADGHAQIKKWFDKTVLTYGKPNGPTGTSIPAQQIPPADLNWLQALSTTHL